MAIIDIPRKPQYTRPNDCLGWPTELVWMHTCNAILDMFIRSCLSHHGQ
jgi:hypothetical protein